MNIILSIDNLVHSIQLATLTRTVFLRLIVAISRNLVRKDITRHQCRGTRWIIFCSTMLFPLSGSAYIGPGLGVGAIGIVLGILAAIVIGFFAILWYPVKRIINRRKTPAKEEPEDGSEK